MFTLCRYRHGTFDELKASCGYSADRREPADADPLGDEVTLQDLGNIGEFVAAIATLITLIYLAAQIRQNTRAVRSSAFQQVVDSFSEISLAIGLNREVSEIFDRARVGLSALDSVERRRHWSVLLSLFRRAESVFFQSEQGTLPFESWEGIRELLRSALQSQGARQFWDENSFAFNDRFKTFVESELLERT